MARSHGYSSGIHCRIISEKNRKEFLHAISVHLVPCHVSPHLKTVPSLSVHFSQLRYCFLVWLDSSSSIHSRPRDHFRVILRNSIHPPFCSGVGVIQRPNHSVAMISAPGEPNMVPLWHVSRCDLMSIPHSRIFGLSKNGGDKENTFPGGERIFWGMTVEIYIIKNPMISPKFTEFQRHMRCFYLRWTYIQHLALFIFYSAPRELGTGGAESACHYWVIGPKRLLCGPSCARICLKRWHSPKMYIVHFMGL